MSHLAYVFQDATLLPWRTVFENVRLPWELAGQHGAVGAAGNSTEVMQRIAEALQAVGLAEESWQKFPRELSGGMRMRTSIARALVIEP